MADKPDMRERYEHALAEVIEMKRALAERARHVAELEERLMRQVEQGARGNRSSRPSTSPSPATSPSPSAAPTPSAAPDPGASPAPNARPRRRASMPEPTESDLARAVAAAEAEKALAQAERERLDERERNIRQVERELAGLRMRLENEWRRLKGTAPPQPETPSDPGLEPAARRTSRQR